MRKGHVDWNYQRRDRMEGVRESAGRMAVRIPVLSHPPTIPVAISPEGYKPSRQVKPGEQQIPHPGIQFIPP